MTESPSAAPRRRAAVAFVFVTVVLDVLALGIVIPVLPELVESFLHGDTVRAARVYGLFVTVWALMQFLFSPLLGALSDRFGRRRVILLSNLGLGLDYIFMAMAPSLEWLLVGRIISGITGASYGAAGAYIADVTPPAKRAAGYGILGAAWGLGFVLGPALGGILGATSPRLPFWAAAILSLLNAAYGLFVLPESLPPEKRSPRFSWHRGNPVGSLALLRSEPKLLGLASVNVLYYLSHQALSSVFVLYATYRYGWNVRTMGLTLAAVGVGNVLVQGGLVRVVVARSGERVALLAGLLFGIAGFVVFGLAPTALVFWLGIPIFAPVGLFQPAVLGLMTRRLGPTVQGQLQGANSSLMGLCGLVGPAAFTLTFAHFISPGSRWQVPGAAFLLAALLLVVGLVIGWQVTRGDEAPRAA